MRRLAVTMMVGLATLFAQSQPVFEVASVRVSSETGSRAPGIGAYGKGRFTVTYVTLEMLLCIAYEIDDNQILNAPGWLSTQHFDVDAKPEAGIALTYEQVKPRLQALLKQRFKLLVHTQTREVGGYALVVAKGGPKLQPATPSAQPGIYFLPNGIRNPGANMEMLAAMLTRPAHRIVVDGTGVKGSFDIKLDYAPEGATDSPLPSVFTALQEQLGLRLENRKVPQETLVIEHVERVPVDN